MPSHPKAPEQDQYGIQHPLPPLSLQPPGPWNLTHRSNILTPRPVARHGVVGGVGWGLGGGGLGRRVGHMAAEGW